MSHASPSRDLFTDEISGTKCVSEALKLFPESLLPPGEKALEIIVQGLNPSKVVFLYLTCVAVPAAISLPLFFSVQEILRRLIVPAAALILGLSKAQ